MTDGEFRVIAHVQYAQYLIRADVALVAGLVIAYVATDWWGKLLAGVLLVVGVLQLWFSRRAWRLLRESEEAAR